MLLKFAGNHVKLSEKLKMIIKLNNRLFTIGKLGDSDVPIFAHVSHYNKNCNFRFNRLIINTYLFI